MRFANGELDCGNKHRLCTDCAAVGLGIPQDGLNVANKKNQSCPLCRQRVSRITAFSAVMAEDEADELPNGITRVARIALRRGREDA